MVKPAKKRKKKRKKKPGGPMCCQRCAEPTYVVRNRGRGRDATTRWRVCRACGWARKSNETWGSEPGR